MVLRVGFARGSINLEKIIHDRAVEPSQYPVTGEILAWIGILRESGPGLFSHREKLLVGKPDCLDTALGHEVETVPEFDRRPNDCRTIEFSARLSCPLEGADRIVLPKIAALAKPIVIFSTW